MLIYSIQFLIIGRIVFGFVKLEQDCQPFGLRLFLGRYYTYERNQDDALRVVFNTNNQCKGQFTLSVAGTSDFLVAYYDTQLLNMTRIYENTQANIKYETYIHTFKIPKQEKQKLSYILYRNNIALQGQTVKLPTIDQDTTKVVFFGDMDSSWVMNRSKATFDWLKNQTATDSEYDSILFTGDMAYDLESDNCTRGELWLRNISEFTQKYPFMVTPGNHDGGYNYKYDFLRANFQMLYLTEYDTPQYQNDFYSFDIGLIHFIAYDPVLLVYKADQQNYTKNRILAQFKNDLEQAKLRRSTVPWIVVFTHYPIYCNYMADDQCINNFHYLAEFESLFQEYHVDLYMSGHQHNYQRNMPYYQNNTAEYTLNGNVFSDYESPVSIIEGAGGADYGPQMMIYDDQPYTMKQLASNGVGVLECSNSTHLHFQHIQASNNAVMDEIWIVHNFVQQSEGVDGWFVLSMILIGLILVCISIGVVYYKRGRRQNYLKAVDSNVV